MMRKLGKNHKILCTSRNYREVVELAKLKRVNLQLAGKHGGSRREGKLKASIQRMVNLVDVVTKFSPDLTISFCSPEAARVAFGLGIKHIVFSDSPHAEAVMRLSIPLAQKVLIPWIIPKRAFEKFGISRNDIIQYKAIDAATIVKDKSNVIPFNVDKSKKTIVIRPEESEAAYITERKNRSNNIIREFSKENERYNIIVLARYQFQKDMLKREYGNKVKVMDKIVDGKSLLSVTDVFIGSGGTMTAESALMGIPTISYDAAPNYIDKYLVRIGLVRRETNPKNIVHTVKQMLHERHKNKKKASVILNSMEDPFTKLIVAIKTIK
jgi:predicted glycosyltransferase